MSELLDLLAVAEAALSKAARIDRAALGDDELVAALKADERVGRFSDTGRVLDAGEVAERSRHELGTSGLSMRLSERKPHLFVEQVTRIPQAEASRRIRIGLAIRERQSLLGQRLPPEHPIVATALVDGAIGIDTAAAILYSLKQAANGSGATPDRLDEAELALVRLGTVESADLIADAGRLWRDALDPDGIEPRYEEIRERRMVTVGRERNGIKNYNIKADPMLAAVLDAVFLESMDEKAGPRFLSEDDRARATRRVELKHGEEVEIILDPRSREQKRADYLEGALTAGLRATREGATDHRTVGTVTAIISLRDLQSGNGFGTLEGLDEVIPASVIRELVCENGFYPVIVGNRGEALYHGTLKRSFTRAQRRAIIARDGDRCVVPGCATRAASSHAHHVQFYETGGRTDVTNGVMLCPAHHHALHQHAFELTMIDGMPHLRYGVDAFDDSAWKPVSRNRLLLATA